MVPLCISFVQILFSYLPIASSYHHLILFLVSWDRGLILLFFLHRSTTWAYALVDVAPHCEWKARSKYTPRTHAILLCIKVAHWFAEQDRMNITIQHQPCLTLLYRSNGACPWTCVSSVSPSPMSRKPPSSSLLSRAST